MYASDGYTITTPKIWIYSIWNGIGKRRRKRWKKVCLSAFLHLRDNRKKTEEIRHTKGREITFLFLSINPERRDVSLRFRCTQKIHLHRTATSHS